MAKSFNVATKRSRLENELGINIGATMVRFCDFKKFSTSSQNYGLRPGNATVFGYETGEN